ncbi:MAG: type IV pilus assembly protein PilM [Actinomycetota bacterium]|nr:type IV pilus assembly protein PilM [Actinomycetota bacterium]
MSTTSQSARAGRGQLARSSIGLDIGSTAVRAAELRFRGGGWEVARYAQVGLPHGAVVDGEVRDVAEVGAALRRLWSAGGFSSRRVVLGVSGQRLVVRQADAPNVSAKEMRSAIGFKIEDLVPLPAANVEFDLQPLASKGEGGDADRTVVLAAVHGDVVRSSLAAAHAAKLEVRAVDAVPLALVRAAASGQGAGTELLVSIGGDLSVLAVMEEGRPGFIRILGRGGGDVTRVVAEATSHDVAGAEAAKRAGSGVWTEPLGRAAADAEVHRLVVEVRETLAFFRSRPETAPAVERVLVSGGGARTTGLVAELASELGMPVGVVDVPTPAQLVAAGLEPGAAALASPGALTPVGLALWPVAPSFSRLDLYPLSLRAEARARRVNLATCAAGVLVVAALAGAWGLREHTLSHLRSEVAATDAQIVTTRADSARYRSVTTLQDQLASAHALATDALTGDVDWIGLLSEIGSHQPKGVVLQSFSGNATALLGQGAAPTPGVAPTLGDVTLEAQFDQRIPQVSAWLAALETIPGLQDTWVSSVSAPSGGGSPGTFAATTTVGTAAASTKAQTLPGGTR